MAKYWGILLNTRLQSSKKVSLYFLIHSFNISNRYICVFFGSSVYFKFVIIVDYSKQVKQRVTEPMLFVHNLEEKITYTFTVKAQTIGYGTAVSGNVTTGPQQGAPERVSDLSLSFTISAVKLSWRNGNSGKSPILGYYIESRRKGKVTLQILITTTHKQSNHSYLLLLIIQ